MLLYSHYLDSIIAVFFDTGKHIYSELFVCTHSFVFYSHPYMALVNQKGIRVGLKFLCAKLIRQQRVPHLCAEYMSMMVLYYPGCPCGDTFALATIPTYNKFVQVVVFYFVQRQFYLPLTVTVWLQSELFSFLPAVEIAYHIDSGCIRGPFSEYPRLFCFVKPKIQVS